MARPREFDRDAAVQRAMSVFWRKGYAATSTDDLLRAMNIGRQSMYDTFGDKHRLYLETLERYQRESVAENIRRLRSTASPLAGVEALVIGIIASDKSARERGCMGVGSICEFGNTDTAARFVETTMFGLQVAAKAGASLQSLRDTAAFAIASLRNQ